MGREKWLKLWTKGLTYRICSELKFDDYFCELKADGLVHLDMKSQFQNKKLISEYLGCSTLTETVGRYSFGS